MRLKLKNKIYKQLKHFNLFEVFPKKLLKSYRGYSKSFQKQQIRLRKGKQYPFVKRNTVVVSPKKRSYLVNQYSEGLYSKRQYYQQFDYSVRKKFLKKNLKKSSSKSFSTLYKNFVWKLYYRLDILLWNLKVFSSIYAGRQQILHKKVLVNGISVSPGYVVKKGDIITLPSCLELSDFLKVSQKYFLTNRFLTFLEVDFYTRSIIIIRDIDELTVQDWSLLMTKSFDLRRFMAHIK